MSFFNAIYKVEINHKFIQLLNLFLDKSNLAFSFKILVTLPKMFDLVVCLWLDGKQFKKIATLRFAICLLCA